MAIDLEKLNAELDHDIALLGIGCTIEAPLDAELCVNAAAMVVDEATEFIVAVADLLLKTNEFPDLQSDGEIVAKIERWIDLLKTASRMDSLNDDEVFWRYQLLDFDCMLLAEALQCLIRDKVENARRGFTPLKVANYLTESLSKVRMNLQGFKRFEYDYSAIIAENREYSRLAKGER